MAKLQNPFGVGKRIFLTQTNHTGSGNTAIDCITDNTTSNTPIYAIASGKIIQVTGSGGSYVAQSVDGASFNLFYVHIDRFAVRIGQTIKVGDLLGYMAPKSVTGYAMHLHLGITAGFDIMDYLTRDIDFQTNYQDIADIWFNGKNMNGGINWSLFKDLSYDNSTNMSFKKGDVIIFTEKQNKRGGAGTGFADIGAYEVGEIATIKDGPRTSQNAQFYGKGSDNKTNDKYQWFDTIPSNGQASCWIADMGKFRLATPEEINPPVPTPKPEPTPQPPVSPPELVECQSEVSSLKKEIGALKSKLEAEIGERVELQGNLDRIKEERDRFEKEKLDLEEQLSKGSLVKASTGEIFAELWNRIIRSIK